MFDIFLWLKTLCALLDFCVAEAVNRESILGRKSNKWEAIWSVADVLYSQSFELRGVLSNLSWIYFQGVCFCILSRTNSVSSCRSRDLFLFASVLLLETSNKASVNLKPCAFVAYRRTCVFLTLWVPVFVFCEFLQLLNHRITELSNILAKNFLLEK